MGAIGLRAHTAGARAKAALRGSTTSTSTCTEQSLDVTIKTHQVQTAAASQGRQGSGTMLQVEPHVHSVVPREMSRKVDDEDLLGGGLGWE